MLYEELLERTNGRATYDQYIVINSVYESHHDMSKDQAVDFWNRRYDIKDDKPRTKELKEIKQSIKDFISFRKDAAVLEKRITAQYDKEMNEYAEMCGHPLDENGFCEDYHTRQHINELAKHRDRAIFDQYESFGNDSTIHLIYKDGSECIAGGNEIVNGSIAPKLQNIAYAYYGDGWCAFDTLIGEWSWDVSVDLQFADQDEYEASVQVMYGTKWGRKHAQSMDSNEQQVGVGMEMAGM